MFGEVCCLAAAVALQDSARNGHYDRRLTTAQLLSAFTRFVTFIAAFSMMWILQQVVAGASDGQSASASWSPREFASFEFIFKISASFTHAHIQTQTRQRNATILRTHALALHGCVPLHRSLHWNSETLVSAAGVNCMYQYIGASIIVRCDYTQIHCSQSSTYRPTADCPLPSSDQ